MSKSLHILAFGAHPDDVEIGMGGTISKYAKQGFNVGICSLTKAELSSNGTVDGRQEEAEKAAAILGIHTRLQLDFPDRGLHGDEQQIREVVHIIRTYQPTLVFAPYHQDRHPDHGRCASIVKEAIFSAGIKNFTDKKNLPAHRIRDYFLYMINGFHKPHFIIDISEEMEQKLTALRAYNSQFSKQSCSVDTPLTNDYLESVKSREQLFGKEVGVKYGEGFMSEKPILFNPFLGEE